MIQSGRPLLAALVALLLAAPAAGAASRDNVVEVKLPRPSSDEMVLARAEIAMAVEGGGRRTGPLAVRRVRRIPDGFGVGAVRAGQRGGTVLVRLVAVRTGADAKSGKPLRVRLRVGRPRHTYRRLVTSSVRLDPTTRARRHPDCASINAEAERWRPVRRLRTLRFGIRRFGAMTAVGAAQELACGRDILSIEDTERFLYAVDREYRRPGGTVEGFYATWARDADGRPRICLYVRGRRDGEGDVTVAGTTQPFRLDSVEGIGRVDTIVPGEGRYELSVRWRQPDGSTRESRSSLRVPADEPKGNDPAPPYSAAGNCA